MNYICPFCKKEMMSKSGNWYCSTIYCYQLLEYRTTDDAFWDFYLDPPNTEVYRRYIVKSLLKGQTQLLYGSKVLITLDYYFDILYESEENIKALINKLSLYKTFI